MPWAFNHLARSKFDSEVRGTATFDAFAREWRVRHVTQAEEIRRFSREGAGEGNSQNHASFVKSREFRLVGSSVVKQRLSAFQLFALA